MSRTVFSALSGMRLLACLIVAPQQGYDEPAIISYAISPFCPTGADGLHDALQISVHTHCRLQVGCRSSLLPGQLRLVLFANSSNKWPDDRFGELDFGRARGTGDFRFSHEN